MATFQQRRRELDEAIHAEMARRRAASDLADRDDVMSMLLQARDEDGEPLTDRELRDELITLLVAGHETTATGLAWTFDLLLHTPRVLERLRGDLGDSAYLDAVVKEALRLRPVVPGVGRVVRPPPERQPLADHQPQPQEQGQPRVAQVFLQPPGNFQVGVLDDIGGVEPGL